MKARTIVATLVITVALLPIAVAAQSVGKVPRIGVLFISRAEPLPSYLKAFEHGLRQLGYVPGSNILIEARFSGTNERLTPSLKS